MTVPEKRLLRPVQGRVIGGVCAGIARYFGVDATLVRIAWVLFVLLGGAGILFYLICWLLVPEE
jgi:phage shock protein PspC (stress-responsive transcriptional regulator)